MKTHLRSPVFKSLPVLTGLLLAFATGQAFAQFSRYVYDAAGNLAVVAATNVLTPVITVAPENQVASNDGTVRFSVGANGAGPLSYQWLSNGVPIPGAIGDALVLTNVSVPKSIVVNGGFELPILGGSFQTLAAGTNLTGWIIESGTIDMIRTFWQPAEGNQSIDLNGTSAGTIYQDIPTEPGQAYEIRFSLAANVAQTPVIKTNQIWWDGNLAATTRFDRTGFTTANMGWTNIEVMVSATTTNTRLKFVGLSPGAAGSAIDAVSVLRSVPAVDYRVVVTGSSVSVTSSVVRIDFDSNGNGLADLWERTHFAGYVVSADADTDGDGISNRDEYTDGTDPTDPSSVNPRLTIDALHGGTVLVSPLKVRYQMGELVQLTAIASPGNAFVRWIGSTTSTNPSLSLTMNESKSIIAVFAAPEILVSGENRDGFVAAGEQHFYQLPVHAGESVILRCGDTSGSGLFGIAISVLDESGNQVGSGAHNSDAYVSERLMTSGVYRVVVSGTGSGQGSYRLRPVIVPAEFVVPSGDEGGALTNGLAHDGVTELGDEDIWVFPADAGDSMVLRCARLSAGAGYYPYIRLFGPNGAMVQHDTDASDAFLTFRATNSGIHTVVVGAYYPGETGTYRLNLFNVPDEFQVGAGDEGGSLTNGGRHAGLTALGDEDPWSFEANAGDNLVVRAGQVSGDASYFPYIRLYGPDGVMLNHNAQDLDSIISIRATNSGTFTVLIGAFYQGYSGGYNLHFSRMPGAFVVPPDDQGGTLFHGLNHNGTNDIGDEDMWSFTANSGNSIILRCANVSGGSYHPYIRLFGPTGAMLGHNADNADSFLTVRATNSGTFTVLVGSFYSGYSGSYRLQSLLVPEPYAVPGGDEGGLLLAGITNDAVTQLGDEDAWTLTAFQGSALTIRCEKLTGTLFAPWIRLYGANGAKLAESAETTVSLINYVPTNSGNFTLVVGSYYQGYSGTYRLSGTGFGGLLKMNPGLSGTNLVLKGNGGVSNASFVVLASTNVAAPIASWTPVATNQFDAFGQFNITNGIIPGTRARFFRLWMSE